MIFQHERLSELRYPEKPVQNYWKFGRLPIDRKARSNCGLSELGGQALDHLKLVQEFLSHDPDKGVSRDGGHHPQNAA